MTFVTNQAPFRDDFDESKNFYRVLFLPSRAVQARELTQMQTIIASQIERFGKHIFKEGSKVIGAQSQLDQKTKSIKLEPRFAGSLIDATKFTGKNIVGEQSGATAYVLKGIPFEGADPDTLVIQTLDGISFVQGENLLTDDGVVATVATIGPFFFDSCVYGIDEGAFFIRGAFVYCAQQSIVLSKYTKTPSAKIGLDIVESIIDEIDDQTLLDNAQGSYNFSAPGAHRYTIDLVLTTKELNDNGIEQSSELNFVELARIVDGKIQSEARYPIYGEIEKTFARRTFDESGDYTVTAFGIQLRNSETDESKYVVGLEKGKAYVKGFEVETIGTTFIESEKARDFEQVSGSDIATQWGNYVIVNNLSGFFNINYGIVDLHNVPAASASPSSKVGSARVRGVRFEALGKYRVYLTEIKLTSGNFGAVDSIVSQSGFADIDNLSRIGGVVTGDTFISESSLNGLIFQVPQSVVRTIRNENGQVDTDFTFQRSINATFNGGISIISTLSGQERFFGSGLLSDSTKRQYYIVAVTSVTNPGSSGVSVGQILSFDSPRTIELGTPILGVSQTAIFDIKDPTASFTANIIATISANSFQEKTKSLITNAFSLNTLSAVNSLGVSDGFKVVTIVDANGNDVADRFVFDGGQRDSLYDHATLTLLPGPPIATPVVATIQYFLHGGIGYFSVDSYGNVPYEDIPSFTSPVSGKTFQLRDCIDFRPRRVDGDTSENYTVTTPALPEPNLTFSADYSYYVPRVDKVILNKNKEFVVKKGVSSQIPVAPEDSEDGMTLYILNLPAYTFKPSDIKITFIENKRYTMRDIGKIEKRVERLEYYTVLSLLERETKDLTIRDADGNERFKNGFLVDSFVGHSVGDVFNNDYSCSVDFERQELRPSFTDNFSEFSIANSSGIRRSGNLALLDFTTKTFISQPAASKAVNVNPFAVVNWIGEVRLDPNTDTWISREQAPDVIVNDAGTNDLWAAARNAAGTQWNDWQSIVTGVRVDSNTQTFGNTQITNVNTTTNFRDSRSGIQTTIDTLITRRVIGNRVINTSVVPFIRSRKVYFAARNMKPSTQLYAFFDSTSVGNSISRAAEITLNTRTGGKTFRFQSGQKEIILGALSGAYGTVIYDDGGLAYLGDVVGTFSIGETVKGMSSGAEAIVSGYTPENASPSSFVSSIRGDFVGVFNIPSNNLVRFRTGQRLFRLTDSNTNTASLSTTAAEAIYTAQGTIEISQRTILSTSTPVLRRTIVTEERLRSEVTSEQFFVDVGGGGGGDGGGDPLSQTFFVSNFEHPNGVYITHVDLFFETKDERFPVTVQIRPTVNGYPSSNTVVPYGEVSLHPELVNISSNPNIDDPSTYTRFNFDQPVYLAPGEWCITVLTNSVKYTLFVAGTGERLLGTDRIVSEQPYIGSLFKSQNTSTWTAVQEEDMMFSIGQASFASNGSILLNNNEISPSFDYSTVFVNSTNLVLSNTSVDFAYKTNLDSLFVPFTQGDNLEFFSMRNVGAPGTFQIQLDISSANPDVSPAIDLSRFSAVYVKNIINNSNIGEDGTTGGESLARYISRPIVLEDGFDASDLNVYLTANKPSGTEIDVYYKVLSASDSDIFQSKNWFLMKPTKNVASGSLSEFREIVYVPSSLNMNDEIEYTNSAGATFNTFKTFAVKIVLRSINPAVVPKVADMRAIALL